jgi:hypothetical protein
MIGADVDVCLMNCLQQCSCSQARPATICGCPADMWAACKPMAPPCFFIKHLLPLPQADEANKEAARFTSARQQAEAQLGALQGQQAEAQQVGNCSCSSFM